MKTTCSGTRTLGVLAVTALAAAAGHAQTASVKDTAILTGIVRDFRELSARGGHPDFEKRPDAGYGLYHGVPADSLDAEGKPVLASTGRKVITPASDRYGRVIMPTCDYLDARVGDTPAELGASEGGAVTDAASFAQWFRDLSGVNLSRPHTIALRRDAGTGAYVFDDKLDPAYQKVGGFFPINGQLYGNSGGDTPDRNHHFTFELETNFVYRADSGQVFTFVGDDDVWVFIDGKKVIDLGGVHGAQGQTILMDRLGWLLDGNVYTLKFFFAERHRTQSNFRIETTIQLFSVEPPAASALYD
ncbi:MAG: fibro-slime domain-containing protein [Phycisphaerales bacterium]